MSDVLTMRVVDGIGVVEIDSPPVNALGFNVRKGLWRGFETHIADPAVKAIVLICVGRTFFAGADITEFGKPVQEPDLRQVIDLVESSPKPTIAAIHGTALGGGYELSLGCNYRVAVPSAKVGLPEVNLGLLPGAGGTQRLPRIVGVEAALDIMLSGAPMAAGKAQSLGMVDAVVEEGRLEEGAIAFAQKVVAEGRPLVKVRDRAVEANPDAVAAMTKKYSRLFKGFKAAANIVKTVEAASSLPFDEGMARERELFLELRGSNESKAQRYAFFAERATTKVPDIGKDVAILPIKSVGVIGAGTMGGGITMNFIQAGLPVTLVEMNQEALDRGLGVIRKNYERSASKGSITAEQVETYMGLIKPALGLEALGEVDLVIEAVFEEMSIKKDIFGKLDKICKQGAILASNTSFLDVNEIASATSRPEWVVGLHFFSPANVMRLLEVVRGAKTSKEVVATSMELAKTIRKVPVLAGVCFGFIANRIMAKRTIQAEQMVIEGVPPARIDKVGTDYGFAVGSFGMMDIVGLDVLTRGQTERSLRGDFVTAGRLGQKSGGGFYNYDENRKASHSDEAAKLIADFAAYKGIAQNPDQSDEDILFRLLLPVANEGAKCLEEGIALRASDIDMACILGYNWPLYTGGPMFWADTIGLPRVLEKLKEFQASYGDEFKPAALLEKLANEGKSFTGE
jgi:3-hydroxyacyl-CoA dehydrogenase